MHKHCASFEQEAVMFQSIAEHRNAVQKLNSPSATLLLLQPTWPCC